MVTCSTCKKERAALRRPKTLEQLCRGCFYQALEDEVHATITSAQLFRPGERVAVAASGGKDSTVLAHMLTLLNERHGYGLDLFLLSIDEGIAGYRDDSLETVKRNEETYGIPLKVLSYEELYGWSMDAIVRQIGTKNNCTFCGVFRRQALDRGAALMKADKIATGHNADDVAETVLLNILRGDVPRLSRCASITTGAGGPLPRVKPFKYTYEKEIVMYAYFKRLDYFSTECVYAPFAARGFTRDLVKDLEACRPSAIIDLIHSAETWTVAQQSTASHPAPRNCERCGYICSQPVCKACLLLEGLNRGLPRLGISKVKRGGGGGGGGGRPCGNASGGRGCGSGACGGGGKSGEGEGATAAEGAAAGGGDTPLGQQQISKVCCGGGGCGGEGSGGGPTAAAGQRARRPQQPAVISYEEEA